MSELTQKVGPDSPPFKAGPSATWQLENTRASDQEKLTHTDRPAINPGRSETWDSTVRTGPPDGP
jgi:hypothetical protein